MCIVPLLLTGCSTVTTVHPIGSALDGSLSEEISGTWMASQGHQLQVHCDKSGNLHFAAVEWKGDPGRFELESGTGVLRSLGDLLIFNYIEDEESGISNFVLLRVWDGYMVVWTPDVARFRTLVEEGKLAGVAGNESEYSDVQLTGSSAEITELLGSMDAGVLFTWSEPAIALIRISRD